MVTKRRRYCAFRDLVSSEFTKTLRLNFNLSASNTPCLVPSVTFTAENSELYREVSTLVARQIPNKMCEKMISGCTNHSNRVNLTQSCTVSVDASFFVVIVRRYGAIFYSLLNPPAL